MIITKEEAEKIVRNMKGKCLSHPKFGEGTVVETEPNTLKLKVAFGDEVREFIYPDSFSLNHLRGDVKVHKVQKNIPKKSEKTVKKPKTVTEKKIESQTFFALRHPFQGGSFTGK